MVRDDYAALSFAIVCYQMLHTTALALGDQRIADIAIRNLEDYATAIMRLGEIVPPLVVEELASEGRIPPNQNVRDAWAHAS